MSSIIKAWHRLLVEGGAGSGHFGHSGGAGGPGNPGGSTSEDDAFKKVSDKAKKNLERKTLSIGPIPKGASATITKDMRLGGEEVKIKDKNGKTIEISLSGVRTSIPQPGAWWGTQIQVFHRSPSLLQTGIKELDNVPRWMTESVDKNIRGFKTHSDAKKFYAHKDEINKAISGLSDKEKALPFFSSLVTRLAVTTTDKGWTVASYDMPGKFSFEISK